MFASAAQADILFEGYSKILLGGTPVGYVVQRYEFDSQKKEFSSTYFLKTNQLAGNITESLRARADSSLRPLSYQFTELVGTRPRLIDAQFNGETMTAKITADGKQQTIQKKIPKGAFLSSFLAYVMLQGNEGIKSGVKYSYQAIAEEDANTYNGEAFISGEETFEGVKAFKILNTFKGTQFFSYCTFKGEVIRTVSPAQKLETELVASVGEATGGLPFNSNTIAQLFGSVPKGIENPIARRSGQSGTSGASTESASAQSAGGAQSTGGASAPTPTPTPTPAPSATSTMSAKPTPAKTKIGQPGTTNPKIEGVPGGKGIIIKGDGRDATSGTASETPSNSSQTDSK